MRVYSDGAARGNPGHAGIGIVILKDNKVISEIAEYIGKTTNNVAEYTAAIRGLTEAIILGAKEVELYSDSELLVKQVKDEYKVREKHLVPLYAQLISLREKLNKFSIHHTRRDGNKHADELANRGIDEYRRASL